MVVPNNHGFSYHFGVFWRYHHLRKPPYIRKFGTSDWAPESSHSTKDHLCLTSLQIGDQVRPHQRLGQPKRPGHKENEMLVEVVRIKAYQDDTTTVIGSTPPKVKMEPENDGVQVRNLLF